METIEENNKENNLDLIVTAPSVVYIVVVTGVERKKKTTVVNIPRGKQNTFYMSAMESFQY